MLNVPISSVRQKLIDSAQIRGLSEKEAVVLADYHLDAQLRGAKTHGIGRFLVTGQAIATKGGPPKVIRDSSMTALVDGQRDLGPLAAQYCVELLVSKAREFGLGLVALKNASRYSHLAPFGEFIASAGFIGLVTNSAGPPAVAPHGSYAPVLGTNPLCMAFPCDDNPIVMDFATSKAVWGEIRQAMLEERDLPPETFYKMDGSFAVQPEDANAVRSFDGVKGYLLCLAIEIFCGAFVGAKMGSAVNDEYDLGFLFLALDPCLFRDSVNDFRAEVAELAQEIRGCPPIDASKPVRMPGDRSNKTKECQCKVGTIELEEKTWNILCQMSVDPQAGMESTDQTN